MKLKKEATVEECQTQIQNLTLTEIKKDHPEIEKLKIVISKWTTFIQVAKDLEDTIGEKMDITGDAMLKLGRLILKLEHESMKAGVSCQYMDIGVRFK